MKRLSSIVIPEHDSRLKPFALRLEQLARNVRTFDTPWRDREELMKRIVDAEVLLPMGGTRLDAETIAAARSLRYIGLGATLFPGAHSNIDLEAAAARGIRVAGVRDYGDVGVAEWVASQAIRFLKRGALNRELAGTLCGIIGAGAAGGLTARLLKGMGAEVRYFSRSRKAALEEAGVEYRSLTDLLCESLVVSLHLPRRTMLLGAEEFAVLGAGKLLVNTSVGLPAECDALRRWLREESNRFAADADGIGEMLADAEAHPRIRYLPRSSGFTEEAAERMFAQVEGQLAAFLSEDGG